jgi:hypothetical protein
LGGTRKSLRETATLSWSSFRTATRLIVSGQTFFASLVLLPLKISSVPLFLNETIRVT